MSMVPLEAEVRRGGFELLDMICGQAQTKES